MRRPTQNGCPCHPCRQGSVCTGMEEGGDRGVRMKRIVDTGRRTEGTTEGDERRQVPYGQR